MVTASEALHRLPAAVRIAARHPFCPLCGELMCHLADSKYYGALWECRCCVASDQQIIRFTPRTNQWSSDPLSTKDGDVHLVGRINCFSPSECVEKSNVCGRLIDKLGLKPLG